jgi:hypothetical protein
VLSGLQRGDATLSFVQHSPCVIPMSNARTFSKVLGTVATVAIMTVVAGQQAKADMLADASGWDYAIGDSGNGTGGSIFDYKGIALKETSDSIFVALNTNMTLAGANWTSGGRTETINYGDLFFNFSGKSFKEASDAGLLSAVHFATTGSDSSVSEVGLYSNVTAKSVARKNFGWNNVTDWSNYVNSTRNPGNTAGNVLNSYGDLRATDTYFAGQQSGSGVNINNVAQGAVLNSIGSGTKTGDIMMMNNTQMAAAGLNFSKFAGANGSQTLGFSFKKTADFKSGSAFIANLFAECGNDGLAIKSLLKPEVAKRKAPEPAAMGGLALVSGLAMLRRRRAAKQA